MIGVAASAALTDVLTGPPVGAVVRGAGRLACYLDVGRSILVIETADGAGLPNAVQMGPDATPLQAARGDAVTIGHGELCGAGWHAVVRRWWNPNVAVGPVDAHALTAAARHLGDPGETVQRLTLAVRVADRAEILAASRSLVGRGPGLTPAGDDVLAGLLATLRVLGPALDEPAAAHADAVADALARAVVDYAVTHTPALSAQLLSFANRSAVARPVAGVLRAIAGDGNLARACLALSRLGHTSGRDLLRGIAVAVDAMLWVSQSAPELVED